MKRQQTAIERGKAQAEQWAAQAEELRSMPSFLHLKPMELIELAERRGLNAFELEALDEAWVVMFGETLMEDAGATSAAARTSEPETDDAPVSGWKAAAKMAGVSVPTLRREVLAGRFPLPQRVSVRRRGWKVGEIKAWRDQLDANRRRSSGR